MLDSLVRVSRRVGGAADLLVTEMPAAQASVLVIRAGSSTGRPRGDRSRGLATTRATNFTPVHAPQAAVRHVKPRRSAVVGEADRSAESLRITYAPATPPPT